MERLLFAYEGDNPPISEPGVTGGPTPRARPWEQTGTPALHQEHCNTGPQGSAPHSR